jgi:hypothetical protein
MCVHVWVPAHSIQAAGSPETSTQFHKTTLHHIPKGGKRHCRRENAKTFYVKVCHSSNTKTMHIRKYNTQTSGFTTRHNMCVPYTVVRSLNHCCHANSTTFPFHCFCIFSCHKRKRVYCCHVNPTVDSLCSCRATKYFILLLTIISIVY